LISIETELGTREFPRLRVGVGAPETGEDLADHVLATFTTDEKRSLPDCIQHAADAVEWVLEFGVEAARPRINAPRPDEA
jgi:peptidyl-tRNA hydrolase, PTH1 family